MQRTYSSARVACAHVDEPFGADSLLRTAWISTVDKLMEKLRFPTNLSHRLTHTGCPLAHNAHRLNALLMFFVVLLNLMQGLQKRSNFLKELIDLKSFFKSSKIGQLTCYKIGQLHLFLTFKSPTGCQNRA